MKERPILFNAPMVQAVLNGSKTQTRRLVNSKHLSFIENSVANFLGGKWEVRPLPYGKPGDQLWVRETWSSAVRNGYDARDDRGSYWYRATDDGEVDGPWKPSIHMPRKASRIQLEITAVRIERLQDCSIPDAIAEGIAPDLDGWTDYSNPSCQMCISPVDSYRTLWDSINGAGSWDSNPWVWVIEFKRVKP